MSDATPRWIGASEDLDGAAPLLRRAFSADGSVRSAALTLCGLGYHEAWINGVRVGDHVLDPAQTDYDVRCFSVTHDATSLLREGANALGVMLGNGFYHQTAIPAGYGWPESSSYGPPCLWLRLDMELADGRTETIVSDHSWRWTRGPVRANNVYAGECYDARREVCGWSRPEVEEEDWRPVALQPGPGGKLEPQTIPPMRRIEEVRPVAVHAVGDGVYVADMGQNLAGWARIRVEAPSGREIALRFAEEVFPDGRVDTESTGVFATKVEQIDRYVCKGGGIETWEPRFTYHGFRYVEIRGWPGKPTAADIVAVVVHTDLAPAGRFECSDERLNRLHRMALWTHRCNIHGLPEDCPARERCGWLGDANMVAEFSMWNFHGEAFWRKYLWDIETTRSRHGGYPCNIAPGLRTAGRANPDWAAAFILLPWYVYLFHGNDGVLADHWEGNRFLLEQFAEQAEEWVLPGGFGDWYDPGTDQPCSHTAPTLTSTVWFHECAMALSRAARVLGKSDEAETYGTWADNIHHAFRQALFDKDAGTFGSQTADALALHFSLAPEGEEDRVLNSLVEDIRRRDTHLNTGIMGVRVLFEVLTRRGHGDLALALMHQNTYPSFGNLIERGATTLWEWWGEAELERDRNPRSRSHPMMGGFDNWFYNTLAGIRPDPAEPGFAHVILEPHPVDGLEWVTAEHESPRGTIRSAWTYRDGRFEWNVVVPEGCRATATLPFAGTSVALEAGRHSLTDQPASAPA